MCMVSIETAQERLTNREFAWGRKVSFAVTPLHVTHPTYRRTRDALPH